MVPDGPLPSAVAMTPSTAASTPPVARLSSPGEIVAALPHLCGFPPQESLVLLGLRGPRRRLGLTLRIDLPASWEDETALAASLVPRLGVDGATAACVVVLTEHGHRDDLVDALQHELERAGVDLTEALHVAAGRWSSYLCSRSCCPADGTPVPPVAGPALSLVAAEGVLAGRAVLGSRAELVASLAAPEHPQAGARAVRRAGAALVRRLHEVGIATLRTELVDRAAALLDEAAEGTLVRPAAAGRLAVALTDLQVRDRVASWALARPDALLALLTQVARIVPPPDDVAVCTVLAWVHYAQGDGAPANVALDRALSSDPGYSLALLLREALDAAVPPSAVRGLLAGLDG